MAARAAKDRTGDVRRVARQLILPIARDGGCEFVRDFALRYPAAIFTQLFGTPIADADQLTYLHVQLTYGDETR